MYRTNYGWCIGAAPGRLGKFVCLLCVLTQKVLYWAGNLAHPPRNVKQIHLIISLSHLVGYTAGPCLDLVERKSLLVISRFTNIHGFVRRESTRPAFGEPRDKHDKAVVQNIPDLVISVLPSFDYFVFEEVLFKAMYCLLRAVVPTSVDPFLAFAILPCPIDLRNDGLRQVVGVTNVNPVPCKLSVR